MLFDIFVVNYLSPPCCFCVCRCPQHCASKTLNFLKDMNVITFKQRNIVSVWFPYSVLVVVGSSAHSHRSEILNKYVSTYSLVVVFFFFFSVNLKVIRLSYFIRSRISLCMIRPSSFLAEINFQGVFFFSSSSPQGCQRHPIPRSACKQAI